MPIGTDSDGTDDNDGPHCRNCHVGASNCDVCHSDDSSNFSAAYTATITASVSGKTNYSPQAFLRQSAVATTALGEKCLDGGFSFPHRTLGANMLKDELYGVDFDGTPRAFGTTRTAAGSLTATPSATDTFSIDTGEWVYWTAETRNATSIIPSVRNDSGALLGAAVENLDSVCIDCHGDATYWNGDNSAFSKSLVATGTYGVYGSTQYNGTTLTAWDLLLKGLP